MQGSQSGVEVSFFTVKDGLAGEIAAADLIISHAGAGSIIEALQAGKHLLVVVNTELADNHQIELAQALSERGHLEYAASPGSVIDAIQDLKMDRPIPLPASDLKPFTQLLDEEMGFA